MFQKLFWVLILLAVTYTAGVFYAPEPTDKIASIVWLETYNDFVRSFKSTLNDVSTDIPTKEELVEGGRAAFSWALDIKDTVIDGISSTKETLDTVRSTLSGAESTYKDAKETFDKAKDFVEGASEKVQNVKEALDDVEERGESITNIVDTEATTAITE